MKRPTKNSLRAVMLIPVMKVFFLCGVISLMPTDAAAQVVLPNDGRSDSVRDGSREVPSGALVIAGGGRLPSEAVDRFILLAGGPEARIAVLPTGLPEEDRLRETIPECFRSAKVANVTLLPQSQEAECRSKHFQDTLRNATGIWFGGGRQWRFVDAYAGTVAVPLFQDVLKRGGVIGGSSAGATIQGEYLVRGHRLTNTVVMAEGYEQGFSFLTGSAIDQHFSQRKRHADLITVIRRHSLLLGIGIDEDTAIIVRGHSAEVVGRCSAWFIDSNRLPSPGSEESRNANTETDPGSAKIFYISAAAGDRVDLRTLQKTRSDRDGR